MVVEMTVEPLTVANFDRWYFETRDLAREHGEKRIRKTSLAWLAGITPGTLPENAVLIAHDTENVLGVSVATHEDGPNFTVVRPEVRRQGIARKLIAEKIALNPRYETLVALDNAPSIALMFDAGLLPIALTDNGNGKQVLRFARKGTALLPTEAEAKADAATDEQQRLTKDSLLELLTTKEDLVNAQGEKIAALERFNEVLRRERKGSWLVRLARAVWP